MTAKEFAERLKAAERRIETLERVLLEKNAAPRTNEFEASLVNKHGDFVNKKTAAEIIGVTRATIYAMLEDGRLDGAMEGKCVCVRSIARYLQEPHKRKEENEA